MLIFLAMLIRTDNVLASESRLPALVAKIKPSIVAVGTFMEARSPRSVFMGTGFVIGNGNLVVTNAHVIPAKINTERREQISIFYHKDGKEKAMATETVAYDAAHDIAILKFTGETLPPMKLGNANAVQEGELFAFTGFPIGMVLGMTPVTHRGIISAITPDVIPTLPSQKIDDKLLRRLNAPFNVFQLDATAYPGNSGSPLYDTDTGEVIGIINKVFVQASKENALAHPSGITYAIPVNHIKKLLEDNKLN